MTYTFLYATDLMVTDKRQLFCVRGQTSQLAVSSFFAADRCCCLTRGTRPRYFNVAAIPSFLGKLELPIQKETVRVSRFMQTV
jgi:hypothetical protein